MSPMSIFKLMGWVLACAVCFAALRNANEIWAGTLLVLLLLMIGVATLGACFQQGRDRAWWSGFALFAGGYLVIAQGPWFAEQVQPRLGTTHLLDYVHHRVIGSRETMGRELQELLSQREAAQSTMKVIGKHIKVNQQNSIYINLLDRLNTTNGNIITIQGDALRVLAGGTSNPLAPMKVNYWRTFLPGAVNRDHFMRVGQIVFAAIAGMVGAGIAAHLFVKQNSHNMSETRDTLTPPSD